jgi:hypothetical protein
MSLRTQLKTSVALSRAPEKRPREHNEHAPVARSRTMSIPEAGHHYFGLSKNGSYLAADRGEIPFIRIGRLKRVPIALMERLMEEGTAAYPALAPASVPELRPQTRSQAPPRPSRYPPSTAIRRGLVSAE